MAVPRAGGVLLSAGACLGACLPALALMCRSLPAETLHDIWNPSAGVMPFTLLIFVCWSLACGDHWLLPPAILLASFASQAELTFLLPSVLLLAVGAAGLIATRGR